MNSLITLLFAVMILNGCAPAKQGFSSDPSEEEFSTSTEDEETGLSPTSEAVVYASGWSQLNFIANYAKTAIGVGAHFTTSRNACGKDAYGSISLQDWNALAASANEIALNPPNGPDYCVPIPENNLYLSRAGLSADLKTERGTVTLFQNNGNEVCSKITNHAVSDALLHAIAQVTEAADKEDCPRGWGS